MLGLALDRTLDNSFLRLLSKFSSAFLFKALLNRTIGLSYSFPFVILFSSFPYTLESSGTRNLSFLKFLLLTSAISGEKVALDSAFLKF